MNQTSTLEQCNEATTIKSFTFSSLVFQSQTYETRLLEKLCDIQASVIKVKSFTELVFHARSFRPHFAFIGIDVIQLDRLDIQLIRKKLPDTYLYLLIDGSESYEEIESILKRGFDDVWNRNESTLYLLPLVLNKRKEEILKKNDVIETDLFQRDTSRPAEDLNHFKFIEALSVYINQPIDQLVQFAYIGLQRNHRQQYSKVGHYLAEIKLISQEIKDYFIDLKELLRLKNKTLSFELDEIDLTELLRKAKRQFLPIAENRHIHLEFFNHTEQPYAKGNFSKLSRVLNLLLRDLLKSLDEGESLAVDLKQVNPYFEIVIKASALIFLDQLCLPLFELLSPNEGACDKKRADFGLSLCKELMKTQEGDLLLSHEPSRKNTTFILKIPCLNSLFDD